MQQRNAVKRSVLSRSPSGSLRRRLTRWTTRSLAACSETGRDMGRRSALWLLLQPFPTDGPERRVRLAQYRQDVLGRLHEPFSDRAG
jgi:hypothetical protein